MHAATECRQVLAQVGDRLRRHDLATRMGRKLILQAEHLLHKLPKARAQADESRQQGDSRSDPGARSGGPRSGQPPSSQQEDWERMRRSPVGKVQETLLEVLLRQPELLVDLEELWPGEEICLPDPWVRSLMDVLREEVLESGDFPGPDRLMEIWMGHASGDSERSRWLSDLHSGSQALEEPRSQLVDGVRFLEEHRNQLRIQEVREDIRQAYRALAQSGAQSGRSEGSQGSPEIHKLEIELNRLMKSRSERSACP